ncbi:hypothetical protein HYS31_06545 [Candidatus Woesearchaeota archaeon]|nr:hypothetical protein [Candidatus Woesearchaeota archaeon]
MYLFTNILGIFVFNDKFDIMDKALFKNLEEYQNKSELIEKIKKKYKNPDEPDENAIEKILLYFKDKKFFLDFYLKNLELTKISIRNSVNKDSFIIQSIKLIDELEKSVNLLVKRLREWYELHNPEFSRAISNHETFVEGILNNEKAELLKQLNVGKEDSIGADLEQEDLEPISALARQTYSLYQLRKLQFAYISALMDEFCPNIKAICDVLVAARLIEHTGSLKRLSELPSSTIQVLGAEKALFRHMKTGAKPPRHGVIIGHVLIAKAPDKLHGKIARALADKISIASKIDYFKGKFIGDKLRKELEGKFNQK